MKKWLCFLIAILTIFAGARLYYRLTDDIRLANMKYTLPFSSDPAWEMSPLTEHEYADLKRILDQKFSYIGKGAQSYAFGSEDGKYVIKFFKFKHLRPAFYVENLPDFPPFSTIKANDFERKKRKLISIYNGYSLAFREHKAGSGIIYLHLLQTNNLHLQAHIKDKLGFNRTVPLDDVVFLIQKRGETLRTRLNKLLTERRLLKAQQAIAFIIDMYMTEYRNGMYDRDHGVMYNTGFVGEVPFHLDVGKLEKDERMREKEFYKKDLTHVLWKMDEWIKRTYPEDYLTLTDFLSQEYKRLTGEFINLQTVDGTPYIRKGKFFSF